MNRQSTLKALYNSIDDDHQWELSDSVLDAWRKAEVIASYSTHTEAAGYGPNQQRNPNAHRHLGRSMEMDHNNGDPLRCSLVINKEWGMPGEQYFEKARSLGCSILKNPNDERAFWENQIRLLGLDPASARRI
jgi:hypothetical protein